MILAFDTATPACTAALLSEDGAILGRADEVMERGHAERLMPMLERLLAGRRADAILVGCGPGSFTGLRVGIAAAHGLGIGWGVPLAGFSTLALIAAGQAGGDPIAVALRGGHGEVFVGRYDRDPLREAAPIASLAPDVAAAQIAAASIVGSGAAAVIAARGWGEAIDALPAAADVLRLPELLRALPPKPVYARAPDAKAKAA